MEGTEKLIRGAGSAQCKQSHHININDSIGNIQSIVRQLNNLKDKLNNEGNAICGEVTPEAPTPSFMYVLTNTADNIRAECNEADKILQEINEMLF